MARTLGTRISRRRQGYSNAVEGSFKVGVILYDLRHATRRLLRNWRFACVAVVTLGVGVGVLTALFAVVHAVLLRPVASDQGRLVRVWKDDVAHGMGRHSLSYDEFVELARSDPHVREPGRHQLCGCQHLGDHPWQVSPRSSRSRRSRRSSSA